jgi:hypothetical protein
MKLKVMTLNPMENRQDHDGVVSEAGVVVGNGAVACEAEDDVIELHVAKPELKVLRTQKFLRFFLFREGWTEGGKMMAACSLLAWGAAGQRLSCLT